MNEGQLTSVNGEGSIDFSGNRMKLVVPNAEKAEERQFGRQLYVLLPEQAAPMLGGKQWVKLDLDTVGSKSADPFNLYAYEPRQLVTALTAVHDASLVGSEQVRDTHTTHFTGTVDTAGVASSGAGPTFVKAFRAATKNAATPVDVWLDDEGLVRKMSFALPPAGAPAGNRAQATVELYDFGTADVSFAEPPSTKVATPTDLTSLAGSGD
jgi:ABC-type molybdate transport system substrate-binding protein